MTSKPSRAAPIYRQMKSNGIDRYVHMGIILIQHLHYRFISISLQIQIPNPKSKSNSINALFSSPPLHHRIFEKERERR